MSSENSLRGYPAFILFSLQNACSSFAFQMLAVAVGWQIYSLTGRAIDLALVGLVQFIPSVLIALPAGHAADQYDRRRIMLAGESVAALATALLGFLSLTGGISERAILGLVFVVGCGKAVGFPSSRSLLPGLVPGRILQRAVAMNASAREAATIAGPALGGLLYLAGPVVVYAAVSALYVLAASLVWRMASPPRTSARSPVTTESLLAGIRFIRSNPDVLGVISLDMFAVLLGGATALLPIFAGDILRTGPGGLGLLRAAPAVGALAMSLWLSRVSFERRVGLIMFGTVAGYAVSTIVFAFSRSLWLSLAALAGIGAFDMVSMVIRAALIQLDTPDEMRGRVTAVNGIFINTSNQLGEFESGVLAHLVGAVPAVAIGGFGALAVVAAWMVLFPGLRRRESVRVRAAG